MPMAKDKYSAVWVSHSSISDFLTCPRAYYLKNIYKDPKTGHKIQLMSPPLALGQVVHQLLESLSIIATDERFSEPLFPQFDRLWQDVSGKKGGFSSPEEEKRYHDRGKAMIGRVVDHPGPLQRLAIKIKEDLPYYWLSEQDNIILCGKIDWLEYLPDSDSVHIIDFKTGKNVEDKDSLQLPIYHLLVHNCQQRKVTKASYWYLNRNDRPTPKELPNLKKSHDQVLEVAKKIKLARQLERFKCPHGGCPACQPFEDIITGQAELVGVNGYNQDTYIINKPSSKKTQQDSVIL